MSDPDPFEPIQDNPALPRVLLIGDSISIGYTLPVRELLDGRANLHRPGLAKRFRTFLTGRPITCT